MRNPLKPIMILFPTGGTIMFGILVLVMGWSAIWYLASGNAQTPFYLFDVTRLPGVWEMKWFLAFTVIFVALGIYSYVGLYLKYLEHELNFDPTRFWLFWLSFGCLWVMYVLTRW